MFLTITTVAVMQLAQPVTLQRVALVILAVAIMQMVGNLLLAAAGCLYILAALAAPDGSWLHLTVDGCS